VTAAHLLPWLIVLLAACAAVQIALLVQRWQVGQPAKIDWLSGILALPKRYLVDVHHIVARDPYAAKMHALVAGGLLGGSALLLAGVALDGWFYWLLVAVLFAVMLVGGYMVRGRRMPAKPARLSGGKFQILPQLLIAYAGGCLIVALDAVLGGDIPLLPMIGLVLAAVGGFGLVAQLRTGPLRHAVAGAIHLVAHPRSGRFEGKRETALIPLDLDAPKLGIDLPGQFAWNRLASFDACIQCGRCQEACPAFAAGQPLNPKQLIQDLAATLTPGGTNASYAGSRHPGTKIALGCGSPDRAIIRPDAMIHPDTIWSCTTCRACVEECPMMIEHVDAIVSMRRFQTLELGAIPAKAAGALDELRYADDAGARPLASRTDFAAGLDLPVIEEGKQVDVLLWLGEGAFELRYGRTLRALVQLLTRAGVDFAVLGADERDCGDLSRRLGDEANFQRLARANIATLAGYKFNRIVTADPHALHALRNEYRPFGAEYEVLHHTQFLDELVQSGKLKPGSISAGPIAYHDPCYLGRYNGEIAAPRALIDRLGATRVEIERSGLRSMCCGGGGGAPTSDIPGEKRIADIRMDQARATGAAIVAVACPQCTAMLEGVTGPRPEVRDVAELLLDAMGLA
jgi:Fe-S oxidoreductase